MTPAELTDYLRERIPLAETLGVVARVAGPGGVTLAAPLEPNLNHQGTAFGGSVSAIAILAAWSNVKLRLAAAGSDARIVIHESKVRYERPIDSGILAHSPALAEEAWERFERTLARRGLARIAVDTRVEAEGTVAARFVGSFVAVAEGRANGS